MLVSNKQMFFEPVLRSRVMSNDIPHERFLKLLAKVLMLVVDKKRYIFYVHDVLTGKRIQKDATAQTNWYQLINNRIGEILANPKDHLENAVKALQEILDGPSPVFVEFTLRTPEPEEEIPCWTGKSGELTYFVGTSLKDVLADTNGGTMQGLLYFSTHRVVSEDVVRNLNFRFFQDSIDAVKMGCSSYWLG